MKKCIYLKKIEPEVTFESGEHIIPAGIGGIAKLANGMVSDQFNTKIFSSIELDFMRNSVIAIPREFHGPGKRGSLSERKASKSKVHIMSANGDYSDASLGYIKLAKPHQIPQFKITNQDNIEIIFDKSDGEYNIQLLNFIEALKRFDGKYSTIVYNGIPSNQVLLGNFEGKWYLGVHDKDIKPPLVEYINKLIKASSKLNGQPRFGTSQVTCHQQMQFNIENYFRVCAKIIFNFLAFSRGSDFVLQEKFDPIRDWIVNGGENKFVNLIDKTNQNEKMFRDIYFPAQAHRILTSKIDNNLIGILSLYGENFDTIVILCDNFTEEYLTDGYICDWQNKKEYTLVEYINLLPVISSKTLADI